MGFFDDVWSAVSDPVGTVKKVVKGVKRGAEVVGKGLKNVGRKTLKGLKKTGKLIKEVGEELGKSETWERGAQKAAKILKAPQEFIEKHDPLRKILPEDLKAFSPLSFATGIATAPLTGAGTIIDISSDKKKRKKFASGDADTIIDAVGAGLSLVPVPGSGAIATKVGTGAAKAVGKQVAKTVGKKVAKKVAKKVVKKGAKETAKKIAKKVGQRLGEEAVGKTIELGIKKATQ